MADYTYEELQQFCLVDRDRNVTPYKIPRLKDLLEWGKDKVVFNFDNKYINTRGVSDEVRRASLDYYIKQLQPGGDWSMYHNIMLSVRSVEEALYYWEHGIRNVMFCVEISSMEHFRAYDASPIPWKYIMAYIRLAVNPDLQPVYDLLHAEGVMTMTSITGSSDKVKNPTTAVWPTCASWSPNPTSSRPTTRRNSSACRGRAMRSTPCRKLRCTATAPT